MATEKKVLFHLDDLLAFVFPSMLQHPLATGRLFAFALYGPLNYDGNLLSGVRGNRISVDYELDQMCLQLEREDILQIYLNNPGDLALLSIKEQNMIISQADTHLKKAKGRAYLPRLSKETIRLMFENVPKNAEGLLSFNTTQDMILKFRQNRIQQYKQVFPSLRQNIINRDSQNCFNAQIEMSGIERRHSMERKFRVSDNIAPSTMFQRMKGQTNPDLIEQTAKNLNRNLYKISDVDASSSSAMTSNVRLLRDVTPCFSDPYEIRGGLGEKTKRIKDAWKNCSMPGVGLGSKVLSSSSSSTWKIKVTSF